MFEHTFHESSPGDGSQLIPDWAEHDTDQHAALDSHHGIGHDETYPTAEHGVHGEHDFLADHGAAQEPPAWHGPDDGQTWPDGHGSDDGHGSEDGQGSGDGHGSAEGWGHE
jgi:hypothetical protein